MIRIPLTRGFVAIIDDEDAPLAQFKWTAHAGARGKHYAKRAVRLADGRDKTLLMHRVIIDPAASMEVDHINGDGLDNRRSNLRPATHVENCRNSARRSHNKSGYKGVIFNKVNRNWMAHIRLDGVTRYLGSFAEPKDAAAAYDEAARKLFGDFARPNSSPHEQPPIIEPE